MVVLLVAAAGLAACTGGGDRDRVQASISVSPRTALVDQPVAVTVRGLPAGARTTMTARASDKDGVTWSATAQFEATSAGEVSLGQPSLDGSYIGVNPMGLFTLMAPPPGVVAGVPSSVVNPGWPDTGQPAWTLRGRPLPAVSPSEFGQPNPPGKARAVIPVERIGGPVLLACGELDLVWPSCGFVDAITGRLRAHWFASPVTALRYRDAGHFIGGLTAWYGSMTDDALTSSGGTVAGAQAAQADAHANLLALLASQ